MLSMLLLAPPLGVVAGYLLSAVMIAHATWKWSFYIQSVISAVIPIIIMGIKSKYMDI